MRKVCGVVAVSMVILSGCGGSSGGSKPVAQQAAAPSAVSNPCSVITKAEVEQVIGKPVSEGKLNSMNSSICEFQIDEMGSGISFMLAYRRPGETVDKLVEEMKKRQIPAEPLPGPALGDGAWRALGQAGAYKGSNHLIVTIMGLPQAQAQAAAEQALRKAFTRL